KIAEAVTLHGPADGELAEARLELGALDHLEAFGVEVLEEVLLARRVLRVEEPVVEPDLRVDGVRRAHPVERALDLAPVGRRAALGLLVPGASELDDLARGVLHDFVTADDARATQADLGAG